MNPEEEHLAKIEADIIEMKTVFAANGRLDAAERAAEVFHKYVYEYGQSFYEAVGEEKYLELMLGEINEALAVSKNRKVN